MNALRYERRESADQYAAVVCRASTDAGNYRVIVCRDGIQWIIQRRNRTAGSPAAARWAAESYVTTRAALMRLWRAHSGTPAPTELLALPPRFICVTDTIKS